MQYPCFSQFFGTLLLLVRTGIPPFQQGTEVLLKNWTDMTQEIQQSVAEDTRIGWFWVKAVCCRPN